MTSGPPPLLRDDRPTLAQLGRMAREYDQISRGEHWPATRFVKWLRDDYGRRLRCPVTGRARFDEAA